MSWKICLDESLCIGCKACEVHCKVWNNVPVGIKLGTHVLQGPDFCNGKPVMRAKYITCLHCADAACVEACPTRAVGQREDGIVYIDAEACIGCGLCRKACPWKIPQLDKVARQMRKCDLCMSRLDDGLQPACVTGCTTKALTLVRVEK